MRYEVEVPFKEKEGVHIFLLVDADTEVDAVKKAAPVINNLLFLTVNWSEIKVTDVNESKNVKPYHLYT